MKGKVIDSNNNLPLSDVQITLENSLQKTNSSKDGLFTVTSLGLYFFKKKGYVTKLVNLKNAEYQIIQLELKPFELNEIIITTDHIPKKIKKATAAISIISSKDIANYNNTDFAPILNRAPGIFMQSGALNTNRITIRGIGARNLFGTSKIRAYFRDIPLTNGSGETTIEDFELASIANIEIIKGAASSIYGAGLGGVIHLKPQNAFLNNSTIDGEFQIGSFGLSKSTINMNLGNFKHSFRAVYSDTHSDGYRENNTYNRQTFTFNSNHFLSQKDELSFLASFVNLKAFIPSSINANAFLNNPQSAAFTWQQAQGFEDSKRGVLGVTWNHTYTNNLKQITSVFGSFREGYEPRPFNILEESTQAFGVRSRFLGTTNFLGKTVNFTFGGELFRDTYRFSTFQNLYEDFPEGTGSVQGNELSNFKEDRNYYNLFFETNLELSDKTTLSTGLNVNKTWYNLDDLFPITTSNPDQSGTFNFKNIISPKIGVSHVFLDNFTLYSSISHGFSPISLNETLLPDGQINTNLKPESGWNLEIGSRGIFLDDKLNYSLSIYQLNIKNLLVSRRTALDEFIGINAGKTQHNGLEVAINYKWLEKENLTLSMFTNYTHNNFLFKEFIDDTDDFSGNDLTGVPSAVFNAGLDVSSLFGFYGNINFQYVGSMPITDSNSLFSDSYQLTNLKIGYQRKLVKNLKLNIFLGINNIFDEVYASQILINASSFGGSLPRYFYPGNPVNYYSGIHLNYIF